MRNFWNTSERPTRLLVCSRQFTSYDVGQLFLEEQLTVAISSKSVFSPSVLAKREMFSSSSAALAIAEPSSHSNKTPPAINTRYTHQERKMISAQNIKITSFHIVAIIILISTKFSTSEIFFPGCAIKSGSGLRIKLNNKMKHFSPWHF